MNFVKITVSGKEHEMPAATTVARAAQRVAHSFGMDPELRGGTWSLCKAGDVSGLPLPDDDVIADYDGAVLDLGRKGGYT